MSINRRFRWSLYALVFVIVVIQFIPVDRAVPEYDPSQDLLSLVNAPEGIRTLVHGACYDCHSYETEYPWYAYVSPVSLWLQNHVNHGRGHLNFSEWTTYDIEEADHKLEDIAEEVEEGHMPLNSYTWLHAEARLTDEQRAQIVEWAKALRN